MSCKAIHLTGVTLIAVLTAVAATPPAKPDTRIVEAAAQQDMATVRGSGEAGRECK